MIRKEKLAGVAGFEPAHGDTKNRCLTAWLHPNLGEKYRAMRLWSSLLFILGCVNYADIVCCQTSEIELSSMLNNACNHVNSTIGVFQRGNRHPA